MHGKAFGSEETRRAVAAALGANYEEMAGLPGARIDLRSFAWPEFDLAAILPDVFGNKDAPPCVVTVIPVVEMAAAQRGRLWDVDSEMLGWVAALNLQAAAPVVIGMPDDSMGDVAPKGALLVVDLRDRAVEDGEVFLTDMEDFPVRYAFLKNGGSQVVLSSVHNKVAPPEVLPADDALICGRVVRVYDDPGSVCVIKS
jgi:hypothetical protein